MDCIDGEDINLTDLQWAKRETIRKHYRDLLDIIDADDLMPHLYEKKVIPTESRMESIKQEKTKRDRAVSLLRQISGSDNPDAIPIFIDAMEENNYTTISKNLSKTWKEYRQPTNSERLSVENPELSEENLPETLLKEPYQTASQVRSNGGLFGDSSGCCRDSSEENRASLEEQTEVKRLSGGSSYSFGFHVSEAELVSIRTNQANLSLDEVDGGANQIVIHRQDSQEKQQPKTKTVTLTKEKSGYGFHIMEGQIRPRHEGDDDIYITYVCPELEEKTDEVQMNDTIISVNGKPIRGMSKVEVRQLITARRTVHLELCNYEARQ